MDIFLLLLLIPFLYFNYKILVSDTRKKKIPNKYLLFLLSLIPFFYIYLYIYSSGISYLSFSLEILLAFIISFSLYYYGIWSAGDAKYLLVLTLFIPTIGILSFIGNISIITLVYLLLYFIYFYFFKSLLNPKYGKGLCINIKNDLIEKFRYYIIDSEGKTTTKKTIYKVIKWIIGFLILFVTIRLSRIYLINYLIPFSQDTNINSDGLKGNILLFVQDNYIHTFFISLLLFIGLLYLVKILYIKFKKIVINKLKDNLSHLTGMNGENIDMYFLIMVGVLLIFFILGQYDANPYEISKSLKLIFSYYIIIWFIIKILMYLYKVAFQIAEQDLIKIKSLNTGDIVDIPFLIKNFSTEKCLGAYGNEKGLLYPSPLEAIKKIDNPVTKESLGLIKKIYKISNNFHKNENREGFSQLNTVKILKTFAFSGYIFIGFIITYFYNDQIFKYIFDTIITIIKSLYN